MAAKTAKGFELSCPKCHDTDATVTLDLNDLAVCRCSCCDEEFSPQEAREMIAAELEKWQAVCRMVELAREMIES